MHGIATVTFAYGYYLGNPDGWLVEEADRFGALNLDWYTDRTERHNHRTFIRKATEHLTNHHAGEGTEFLAFGCLPYETNVHIALITTISQSKTYNWGDTVSFDGPESLNEPGQAQWNEQLKRALTTLGLTPLQDRPRWTIFPTYD